MFVQSTLTSDRSSRAKLSKSVLLTYLNVIHFLLTLDVFLIYPSHFPKQFHLDTFKCPISYSGDWTVLIGKYQTGIYRLISLLFPPLILNSLITLELSADGNWLPNNCFVCCPFSVSIPSFSFHIYQIFK